MRLLIGILVSLLPALAWAQATAPATQPAIQAFSEETLPAADRVVIRDNVNRVMRAYQHGSADEMLALFAQQLANRDGLHQAFAKLFEARTDIELSGLQIDAMRMDSGRGARWINVELRVTEQFRAGPGQPLKSERHCWWLQFIRDGDHWALDRFQGDTGAYLMRLLEAAPNSDALDKLLMGPDADLMNLEVAGKLARMAEDFRANDQRIDADNATRLFHAVAAMALLANARQMENGHDERESIKRLNLALQQARVVKDANLESLALYRLGTAYVTMGQYADAVNAFQACLRTYPQPPAATQPNYNPVNNPFVDPSLLIELGGVYDRTLQYEQALNAYGQALENAMDAVSRKMLDPVVAGQLEARALMGTGNVYLLLNQFDSALLAFQKAVTIARQTGDRHTESLILNNYAIMATEVGRWDIAKDAYQKAIDVAGGSPMDDAAILATAGLGTVLAHDGDLPHALELQRRAADLALQYSDAMTIMSIDSLLADTERKAGEFPAAARDFRRCIAQLEDLRTQTRERGMQMSLFGAMAKVYYRLAVTLLDSSGVSATSPASRPGPAAPQAWVDAFNAAESSKARSLIDLMQRGGVDLSDHLSADERQKEKTLLARIDQLHSQFDAARMGPDRDVRRAQELRGQLEQARDDYDQFQRNLFFDHPEVQTARAQFQPASLSELQRDFFTREPNAAIVSYMAGDDEILIFVLTAADKSDGVSTEAQLRIHRAKADSKTLSKWIDAYRGWCQSGGDFPADAGKGLFDVLIAPIAAELAGKQHVVIVPDVSLDRLPFAALRDAAGKYLIESQAVSYAPSVTALLKMMQRAQALARQWAQAPKDDAHVDLLALARPPAAPGLPDLKFSQEEVENILPLFGRSRELLGKDATRANLLQDLPSARIVHLATHALLNQTVPMYSAIVVAPQNGDDGLLYARDLADLKLNAELIVFSACNTALGAQVRGEGTLGLTWSTFAAGCPSTVVSLWPVNDQSTSQLMKTFYDEYLHHPAPTAAKAIAMQHAALALLHDPKYSLPKFWAAFIVDGDAD